MVASRGRGIGGPGEGGRGRVPPRYTVGSQQFAFKKILYILLPYFCFNELQRKQTHNFYKDREGGLPSIQCPTSS